MHARDEQESAKTQHELLRRKVNQDGTGSSRGKRYFFKLIFCCVSRSAGNSLSPGA
jgi:hypothetical protein